MEAKEAVKTESLRDELFRLEPKIDLLHDLLGYGRYAQVHYDGQVFFGMRHGDIGFNDFLGKPSEVALERTRVLLERMSEENRTIALKFLKRFGIGLTYTFTVVE